MTEQPQGIYQTRKTAFKNRLAEAKKQSDSMVLLRSVLFLPVLGLVAYGIYTKNYHYIFFAGPLLLLFLALVIKHQKVDKQIRFLNNLIRINEDALLRLSGKWTGFADVGEQFTNPKHPYSTDLNIFGQGSLYQYLNATTSLTGSRALAKLLHKESGYEEIQPRQ